MRIIIKLLISLIVVMDINNILETISLWFYYFFLFFTILIISSYVLLAFLSSKETASYFKKNSFVDYKALLSSNLAPSVSIIAPAYNESLNIIENVRSLLSIHYVNFNVIIVNDGSSDDSLDKLIKAYHLIKVDYLINEEIETKPLRGGVFKSTNPAFDKLIVVDKENGGKSDALNFVSVGKSMSTKKYTKNGTK